MTAGDVLQVRTSIKGRALDTLRFGERELSVGRDPACSIVFDNPGVSRLHAVITLGDDGALEISDHESSNGTYVNGKRIGVKAALRPGDQIEIGKFTLEVSALREAPVQPAEAAQAPFATVAPGVADSPAGGTVVLGAEQRQRILGESQSPPARAPSSSPQQSKKSSGAALPMVFVAGVVVGFLAAMLVFR